MSGGFHPFNALWNVVRISKNGGVQVVQIGIRAGFETQSKMPDFNVDKLLRRIGAQFLESNDIADVSETILPWKNKSLNFIFFTTLFFSQKN